MPDEGLDAGLTGRAEACLWQFSGREFDEARWELRVAGSPVEIESKPLEILVELLAHAGEVVTKDELLESAWPGVTVAEGSLATAVSKLRRALGDEDQRLVVTIPRIGYRLDGPAQALRGRGPVHTGLALRSGDTVPGRDQWRLARSLDKAEASEVWLAEHVKTHETRVFKFAADAVRLRGLKREVALSRLLLQTLGVRADFVRVLEWNFDAAPYFLECEYGGVDLLAWAEQQGPLAQIPLGTRLELVAQVARSVADAHAAGVLHKDLKPANILVSSRPDGGWLTRVADFGSGWLVEASRLEALRITDPGFARTGAFDGEATSGTAVYLAPEVLSGQAPTAAADVFALGVMLYQLTIGDLRRPLAAGWEAEVADDLLCQDIAKAAAGDPARRLKGAAELAERLEQLDSRREEQARQRETAARAELAERSLQRARTRRPWVIASVTAVLLGAVVSFTLYLQAAHDRDRARHDSAIADAVNQFLAVDLLGRSNPFKNGAPDETLLAAVEAVSPDIDRRFSTEPLVAARLHHAIAGALDRRSEWTGARREYDRAAALYARAEGPQAQDAIIVQLQRSMMEARSYEQGSLPRAKAILARQETLVSALVQPRPELPVWLASARGMIALVGDDAHGAERWFKEASDKADRIESFDEDARLTLRQRLAFAHIRLGEGKAAETLFRRLRTEYAARNGPDSPQVLMVRLNLAQALMVQGRHDEAVREADSVYPAFVARLGPTHELTLQLLTTRAQSEGVLMRWDAAIRDDLAVHRIAAAKQGPKSFFAVASHSDLATVQCRAGRMADGLRSAEESYKTAREGFGVAAALTQAAGFTWAECLIKAGRAAEADPLLRAVDPTSVAQLAGDMHWGANLSLAKAELAFSRKDFATARRELAGAAPLAASGADPYQLRALQTLTKALQRVPGDATAPARTPAAA